jgi:hypothetical protein
MIDALRENLTRMADQGKGLRVTTTTLLPSGALVAVSVKPSRQGSYDVSDDGAGRKDLLTLGYHEVTSADTKRGRATADKLGLVFDGEGFSLRGVTADQLTGAIVFVAEAAREWAASAVANATRRAEQALVQRVEERIRAALPSAEMDRGQELAGASTKRHRFDLVISLPNHRKAVFEVVTPNANSLSATHLKLFDLMGAHPDWPREAITESLGDWSPADMNLLSAVTTRVRGMEQDWRDLPGVVH